MSDNPTAKQLAPELLPCPFCPSTKVMMWVSEKDGEKCCCGFCEGCQAEGPHANTELEAARLWNARVSGEVPERYVLYKAALTRIKEVAEAGAKQSTDADAVERFNWIIERASRSAVAGPTPSTPDTEESLKLRQLVEDTILVAQTDEDADGFITAYHFKTGAIHRLLAEVRK